MSFAWQAHWWPSLRRRRPWQLVLATLLAIAAVTVTAIALPPLVGAVLVVALMVSLDQIWLPVRYRLTSSGVTVRTALRRRHFAWGEFTEVVPTSVGVVLASPVRRSLHLLVDGQSADDVASFCRQEVARAREGPVAAPGGDSATTSAPVATPASEAGKVDRKRAQRST